MKEQGIPELEKRLEHAEFVLSAIAAGDFEQTLNLEYPDDSLAKLEMGINFLILDLKEIFEVNQYKEQELLEKQAELQERLQIIETQAEAIRQLSTPIMEIWDGILVLPVVGVVDTNRSLEIMTTLLEKISESQCQSVIIDITGVDLVDTRTASYIIKVVRASRLLGTRCVITGMRPAVAQTLVDIGADLSSIRTLGTLKAGLHDCIRSQR